MDVTGTGDTAKTGRRRCARRKHRYGISPLRYLDGDLRCFFLRTCEEGYGGCEMKTPPPFLCRPGWCCSGSLIELFVIVSVEICRKKENVVFSVLLLYRQWVCVRSHATTRRDTSQEGKTETHVIVNDFMRLCFSFLTVSSRCRISQRTKDLTPHKCKHS